VAQLERLVEAYRGEVRDLQDRTDRWFRRAEKREEREKPAEISTDNPQAKLVVSPSREDLIRRALEFKLLRRR
jgi:hypothetical protein